MASAVTNALSLLRSQPSHYVVASLVGRRYILAKGDVLTVPRLRDVRVGDSVALDNVHEIGSRDYTLRGDPVIPKESVNVRATVIEHTKGALEQFVKFKRRKGYKRTVSNKQTYTKLRISTIDIPQQPRLDFS
ncbi:ribosomal protein L21-like protein [Auriculariales sp. MPI-PUGE-AT-0066]|nr:ribosomal protein L21-like protein [Auriculariales sp. MPI-PUGE-AT-0066]